ncbi:MAG: hypothetical protein WCG25_09660 [bacterium]
MISNSRQTRPLFEILSKYHAWKSRHFIKSSKLFIFLRVVLFV